MNLKNIKPRVRPCAPARGPRPRSRRCQLTALEQHLAPCGHCGTVVSPSARRLRGSGGRDDATYLFPSAWRRAWPRATGSTKCGMTARLHRQLHGSFLTTLCSWQPPNCHSYLCSIFLPTGSKYRLTLAPQGPHPAASEGGRASVACPGLLHQVQGPLVMRQDL